MIRRTLMLLLVATALLVAPLRAADCEPLNASAVATTRGAVGEVFTIADELEVFDQDTAASSCLDLRYAGYFGIRGSCAGADPDVKLDWQASHDEDEATFETTTAIEAAVTGTLAPESISPPPMKFGRVLLTGNAGNGADTTCTLYLFVQGVGF